MIGASLFRENEEAYKFSFNHFNVVPMYPAFNRDIYYHRMEKQFLKFAQEVTRDGDTVCLIVSVSPDTRYDKERRLGIPAEYSWLRNNGLQINIPRSVSAIAFSQSKTGGVRKVFAFIGNNDDDSPEWYYPHDLSELEHYYWQDGDVTSGEIIKHLKRHGNVIWHPQLNSRWGTRLNNKEKWPDHVYNWPIYWLFHRSIYWPMDWSIYWPLHWPIYYCPIHYCPIYYCPIYRPTQWPIY